MSISAALKFISINIAALSTYNSQSGYIYFIILQILFVNSSGSLMGSPSMRSA